MTTIRSCAVALCLGLLVTTAASAAQKVVMDTDFNTMGDDGQAFVMLVQAMREGKIDLLGLTIVSGNQWRDQEVADALRAVERMGVADRIGVHPGADLPLLHDPATLEPEQRLFGKGYAGAWREPAPSPKELTAPPDGFAKTTRPSPVDAVDFLVATIMANPHEITVLALGPLTNLALAVRKSPQIVPLIKEIVYMGGAVDVPGNVTPAAEFNWWFDPEAARIVLREPIPHVVVPLDVTNTARFDNATYTKIAGAATVTAPLFAAAYEDTFKGHPDARAEVWDTLAAAYVIDPSLAIDVRRRTLDVDTVFGPDYGRALGYAKNPPLGLRPAQVVYHLDLDRFWRLYTMALTSPAAGSN